MKGQCCGNCNAFVKNKDLVVKPGLPHQGWCRAKPPLLMQTMVQNKFAVGGPQMAPAWQGVFPPTASDVWCREWQARYDKHEGALPMYNDAAEDAGEVIDVKPS